MAQHCFRVSGERLCQAVSRIEGFKPFVCDDAEPQFDFVEGKEVPSMAQTQYTFSYEDVVGLFGRHESGYILSLKPEMWRANVSVRETLRCLESGRSSKKRCLPIRMEKTRRWMRFLRRITGRVRMRRLCKKNKEKAKCWK